MPRYDVSFALTLTLKDASPEDCSRFIAQMQHLPGGEKIQVDAVSVPEIRKLRRPVGESLGLPPKPTPSLAAHAAGADVRREKHRKVLQDTLELYQQLGGNAKATARALGVRRNTVHERLVRAAQLGMGNGNGDTPVAG